MYEQLQGSSNPSACRLPLAAGGTERCTLRPRRVRRRAMRVTAASGGRHLRVPASGVDPTAASRARVAPRLARCARRGARARSLCRAAVRSASRRFPGGRERGLRRPVRRQSRRTASQHRGPRAARARAGRARRRCALAAPFARERARFDLVLSPILLRLGRGRAAVRRAGAARGAGSRRVRSSSSAGGVMICRPRRVSQLPRSAATARRASFDSSPIRPA